MAPLAGPVALTICALVAGMAWATGAATAWPGRRATTSLTVWGTLAAVAAAVPLALGDAGRPLSAVLLLAGAVALVVGVSAATAGRASALARACAVANAVLAAAAPVAVLWAAADVPADASWSVLAGLGLLTTDLVAAALVVRALAVRAVGARYRATSALAVAGLGCLAVGDALAALWSSGPVTAGPSASGATVPDAVPLALRAAGYLLAAAIPWSLPLMPVAPGSGTRRAPALLRAVPVACGVVTVGALAVTTGQRRLGPVSVALVALVVGALLVLQRAHALRAAGLGRELAAVRGRLAVMVGNSSDVVLTVDTLGRVADANEAAARVLHRAPDAMAGLDVGELAVPDDRAVLRATVDDVLHGRRPVENAQVRLAPPATGSAELAIRATTGGAVVQVRDVTEAVRLRERLERMARFDELTGLANRAQLLAQIDGWLRSGLSVSVLYGDLDLFKAVNDRFGHRQGDAVLVEAAGRLRTVTAGMPAREVLVARGWGDEFVVALVGLPPVELIPVTEQVLGAMRPTFMVVDRGVRVGMSIGVATSDDPVPAGFADRSGEPWGDADDLLHRADVAMVAAKHAGRFRAVRWDPEIQARARRRVDVAIGLRRALDGHRLALAYQPLVRLSDGAVIGVEALLRVQPEDDGPGALAGLPELVSPAELVAVAEDTGEITEVGHWVITEATLQAARWRAMGYDLFTNVNVSVRQFASDGFVEFVRDALATARLPAESLVVEITESQLISEADPAWGAVERLRAMGVPLVIDDFGTGYSSLAYLRRMPVRGVKLDRALLDDLATDPRARTLARAVIAAARALGLLVVAEGLETLEAARIVRDLGAWAGQGFALFGALPADEVTAVLADPPRELGGHSGGNRLKAARDRTAGRS